MLSVHIAGRWDLWVCSLALAVGLSINAYTWLRSRRRPPGPEGGERGR